MARKMKMYRRVHLRARQAALLVERPYLRRKPRAKKVLLDPMGRRW